MSTSSASARLPVARRVEVSGFESKAIVTERELEALFGRAMHPTTHQQLGRSWRADGVTGYDLCFAAPKSVSALWAIGEDSVPASVAAAHRTAVRTALDYLDSHAAFSRVGTDGRTQVSTGGFAAAGVGGVPTVAARGRGQPIRRWYLLASDHLTFLANGPVCWVEEIMVASEHRRLGIGGALMDCAEHCAVERGAAYLSLASRRAGDFYLALGYDESAVFYKKTFR